MSETMPFERRQHQRAPIVRTCKVRPSGGLRYDPGTTDDASWGGMLVTVRTPRRFVVGDTVDLVVTWADEPVATEPSSRAKVRRVTQVGTNGQRLALELIRDEAAGEKIVAA